MARADYLIHRGARLRQARALLEFTGWQERLGAAGATYLAACAANERRRWLARIAAAALLVCCFMAGVSAFVALNERQSLAAGALRIAAEESPEAAFAHAIAATPDDSYLLRAFGRGDLISELGLLNTYITRVSDPPRFRGAEWSTDGRLLLVTMTNPANFTLWRIDGAIHDTINMRPQDSGDRRRNYQVATFTEDGGQILAWRRSDPMVVTRFDPTCGRCRDDWRLDEILDGNIGEVISANGEHLVIRTEPGSVYVINADADLQRLRNIAPVDPQRIQVTWDGRYLAVLDALQRLRVWEMHNLGAPILELRSVNDYQLSPRSDVLAVWQTDRAFVSVRLSSRTVDRIPTHENYDSFELSDDGARLILMRRDWGAPPALWDTAENRPMALQDAEGRTLNQLVFAPDSRRIVGWRTSDGTGRIGVWDASSGAFIAEGHADAPIQSLRFSLDGSALALNTPLGASIWSVADARRIGGAGANSVAELVLLAPRGDAFLASGSAGAAALWRLEREEVVTSPTAMRRAACDRNHAAIERYMTVGQGMRENPCNRRGLLSFQGWRQLP